MYSINQTKLSNGLPLIAIEIPHSHKVIITIFIKMGSIYESRKANGLSHFLEHILLKGPKDYTSSTKFKQTLEGFGAVLRAETFKEFTYFRLSCLPQYAHKAIINFSKIFKNPRFKQKEIEIERKRILEEILEYQNVNGEDIEVDEIASRLLWPNHPLGRKVQGTEENIKGFTSSDVKSHFQRFVQPNNMLLCIAGNLKNQKGLEKLIEKNFSFLQGSATIEIPKIQEIQEYPQFSFTKNTAQAQLDAQLCFRALSHNHPQFACLRVLNMILGKGETSRLAINLCEKQGLVYYIDSVLSSFSITGTLDINFSVSPERLENVIKEIMAEIKRLKQSRVSKDELSRAKIQLERELKFALDEPEKLSEIFGLDSLLGKVKIPEKKLEEIRKLTAQDVQTLAKQILIPKNLNLIVVGPFNKQQEEKAKKLIAK